MVVPRGVGDYNTPTLEILKPYDDAVRSMQSHAIEVHDVLPFILAPRGNDSSYLDRLLGQYAIAAQYTADGGYLVTRMSGIIYTYRRLKSTILVELQKVDLAPAGTLRAHIDGTPSTLLRVHVLPYTAR